jgi:DNA-binding beta-propeller fold protein YncE
MINRVLTTLTIASIGTLALAGDLLAPSFKVAKFSIGGEGGHDYISAEPGTGRVFLSRGTHVMVVDAPSGKVIGDIPDTPRVHGIGLAKKWNHGFTTNGGDSTVTMFDLKTLAVLKRIPVPVGGLDGIMYDEFTDRIILTTHSKPGTVTAIDARTGNITGAVELEDEAPEGAASDGKGRLFVNNQVKNTIQVVDQKTMKAVASWPLAPCQGPTGIAYDRKTRRIFSGCSNTSVVVDADSGKVVASIANGNGVDAMGWDATEKLLYIPAGRDGTVTIVRQDSANKYTTVATVQTMVGARTLTVDPLTHKVYMLAVEYGPAPADAPPPAPGGFPTRGPVIGAQFISISH